MEFIRNNVFGRANALRAQEADVEEQREMAHPREVRQGPRRLRLMRAPLPTILSGRQGSGRQLQTRPGSSDEEESPKTPRFYLGRPSLPSTRLHVPGLVRVPTNGSSGPPSPTTNPPSPGHTEPRPSQDRAQIDLSASVASPAPIHPDSVSRRSSRRQFSGADPAEMHLADLAESGRQRRRRRGRRHPQSEAAEAAGKPKRFLYCFPWIKSRRIRTQILRCFVSGMFLILLLSIYLALSVTKNINNSEFTILLILIILFVTVFFCHGLIRLCMLIVRPKPDLDEGRARLPERFGPGGYAVPRRPIRVVLARDEDAAGVESEATKLEPPAYGLWRESVRLDPNRLYWQRNEQPPIREEEPTTRPTTANRPPSYISDDGVDYVVEARPRSMAPLTDVPLPPHPSELGRVPQHTNST